MFAFFFMIFFCEWINRYTAAHTLDLYSEVAAICRPPLSIAGTEIGSFKKTQTPSTGYIISVFKVFEGDDGERFEKNWLYWTGARMLYRYAFWEAVVRLPMNQMQIFYTIFSDTCHDRSECDALPYTKAYHHVAIKCTCWFVSVPIY